MLQAFESRSQRGMAGLKRLQADPMFPASGHRVNKDAKDASVAPAHGGNAKTTV